MNDKSAAAEPHSLPVGEVLHHRDLVRDMSETRGEVRVLKWVCGIAFFALLGAMGALYEHQKELGRNIQKVRENVAMVDERTIHMGKRLDKFDGRLDGIDSRLENVENLLRVLVARSASNP